MGNVVNSFDLSFLPFLEALSPRALSSEAKIYAHLVFLLGIYFGWA